MAQKKPDYFPNSSALLGDNLAKLRQKSDLTKLQLGKRVNAKEQQIATFEAGGFIPMAMIEKLAEALDEPIPKKVIRKISALRERTKLEGEEPEELSELCAKVFLQDMHPEDYF